MDFDELPGARGGLAEDVEISRSKRVDVRGRIRREADKRGESETIEEPEERVAVVAVGVGRDALVRGVGLHSVVWNHHMIEHAQERVRRRLANALGGRVVVVLLLV